MDERQISINCLCHTYIFWRFLQSSTHLYNSTINLSIGTEPPNTWFTIPQWCGRQTLSSCTCARRRALRFCSLRRPQETSPPRPCWRATSGQAMARTSAEKIPQTRTYEVRFNFGNFCVIQRYVLWLERPLGVWGSSFVTFLDCFGPFKLYDCGTCRWEPTMAAWWRWRRRWQK